MTTSRLPMSPLNVSQSALVDLSEVAGVMSAPHETLAVLFQTTSLESPAMPNRLNQKTKRCDPFEESLLDLDESESEVSLHDSDDGQDITTNNADLALERDTRTIDDILQDRAKALERAAGPQDDALASTEHVENPKEGVSTALGITVSTVSQAARKCILKNLPYVVPKTAFLLENTDSPSDRSDLKVEVVAHRGPPMPEVDAATSAPASPGPELPAPSDNAAPVGLDSPGVASGSHTVESNTGPGVLSGRKRPRSPDSSESDTPSPVKRPSSGVATTIWALFGKNRDGYIDKRGFSEEVHGEERNFSHNGVMETNWVADTQE